MDTTRTYLISLFSGDGPPPPEVDLSAIMAELEKVNDDIRAAGGWVFAGGLAATSSATVVRKPDAVGDALLTDGPFIEAKEHLGGFTVIDVPDLDAALAMARTWPPLKVPGVSVEVRPVVDHDGDM